MKKILILLAASLLAVNSCTKYDDSALWNEVNDLKTRMTALEKQVNDDIETLKGLVTALEKKKYITNVSPFPPNSEKPEYYLIIFSDGTSIPIYNGVNGEDGVTPQISVEEYDGVFYWKINGQWLEDGGKKIPVTGNDGEDGTDGTTPKIRINSSGYWEICSTGNCPDNAADNTGGWESTGVKATGNNGTPGTPGNDGITPKIRINGSGYWEICSTGNCPDNAADNTGGWESTGVKATGNNGTPGTPGNDGITPKLRINATTNYWQVCTTGTCDIQSDAGWSNVLDSNGNPVCATGMGGTPGMGGDAIFSGIDTSHDDYVTFTLVGGGSISLPKYKSMDIIFTQPGAFMIEEIKHIPFTLTGNVTIVALATLPADWEASVTTSGTSGTFTVTAPERSKINNVGGEAAILLANGDNTIMRTLTLKMVDRLTVDPQNIEGVSKTGGTYFINVGSNATWTVVSSVAWCTINPSTGRGDGTFTATIASTETTRTANITVAINENTKRTIVVTQNSAIPNEGLLINGVIWAKYNVDDCYTFAATPGSYGKFYQYNRNTAIAPTDNLPSYTVDSPPIEWQPENDPCPEGWRLPVRAEMQALLAAGWRKVDPSDDNWNVYGIWFGPNAANATSTNPGSAIFLPAAGHKYDNYDPTTYFLKSIHYWTSSRYNYDNRYVISMWNTTYWTADIFELTCSMSSQMSNGENIRCVKN
jgi:uncharacterized protein (TIGR02145 family)